MMPVALASFAKQPTFKPPPTAIRELSTLPSFPEYSPDKREPQKYFSV
jgi:hypothetical protein